MESQRLEGAIDAQLVEGFVRSRDEAAFAALVRRHGPMVLATCRQVLGGSALAEDAFQAAFLVLARKAVTLSKREPVASWLHRVAYRLAIRARADEARRGRIEQRAATRPPAGPPAEAAWRELHAILDEELARLPEKYQAPLVLCYLEGLTHDEAAARLGWPAGTVKSRLARGREVLRSRLTRRGLAPSLAVFGTLLAARAATAALPPHLPPLTASHALGARMPSPASAGLAEEMLKTGSLRAKLTVLVLFASVSAASVGGWMIQTQQERPDEERPAPAKSQAEKASRTDAFGDPLPEGALFRLGTTRFRHPGPVNALALSPDGKSLATNGSHGGRVWDASTGKLGPTLLTAHNNYMAAQNLLAFSADSQKIFHISDRDHPLVARDRTTGRVEFGVPIEPGPNIHSLNPSPDGKLLAVGTNLGVRIVEIATGRVVWTTTIGPNTPRPKKDRMEDRLVSSMPYSEGVFAPDGKLVVVHASDAPKTLRLLDSDNGEERRRIELEGWLFQFAFSVDGRHIATTEREDAVRVYETATGRRLHSWTVKLTNPYENYTCAVALSPDGKTIAAGATDSLVHLWSLETGRELAPLRGHSWYVTGLAFDPKGRWLYSTGWDGSIRRWDTSTWKEKPVVTDTATGTMARSPTGSTMVWEGDGGILHVGDAATGKKHRTLIGNPAGFSDLALSPDGSILAAGGNDLSVQLWDIAAGKLLRKWSWPKGKDTHTCVERLAFTPDGKLLATASFRSHEVVLWDVQTGERRGRMPHQEVYGAVFSLDGSTLITAGWDRAVRWWRVSDLKLMDTVTLPKEVIKGPDGLGDARLHDLARSPDGRLLATIDLGGAFSVWDAATHKLLRSFPGLRGQCNIAFSQDGQWLTAGDYNGAVGLWDVRSGQQVLKLAGHPARVFNVAFAPDGRTLWSGSDDRTVLLWDLRPKSDEKAEHNPKALWDALAGSDAAAAYQAIWLLADQPDQSVPFLKGKLTPAKSVDKAGLQKLLDSLDSDEFAEREAASKALAAYGEAVELDLQRELAKENSAEKNRRLLQLLERLAPGASAVDVRRARAITALAWANTAEARQLLEALSSGAPEARLTREAKAALERLGRK
jgi:RNA polymerase sigma factor (sigma-70 family)